MVELRQLWVAAVVVAEAAATARRQGAAAECCGAGHCCSRGGCCGGIVQRRTWRPFDFGMELSWNLRHGVIINYTRTRLHCEFRTSETQAWSAAGIELSKGYLHVNGWKILGREMG